MTQLRVVTDYIMSELHVYQEGGGRGGRREGGRREGGRREGGKGVEQRIKNFYMIVHE